MLWVTYDGVQWIPSMYDMDGTWGMYYEGSIIDDFLLLSANCNVLWSRLLSVYKEEVQARYSELRKDILSYENVRKEFNAFFDSIPDFVYECEKAKWTDVPNNTVNQKEQILEWGKWHSLFLDALIRNL